MRTVRLASIALAVGLLLPAALFAQQVDIKPTKKPKPDRYVITKEEIADHPDLQNGYEVVRSLRNQWLRVTRSSGRALAGADPSSDSRDKLGAGCIKDPAGCTAGQTGSAGGPVPSERGSPYAESGASTNGPSQAAPVLYIDEVRQPDLDQLKNLRPGQILEMRYMTGTEASGRYGAGHEMGAILVKMVKPGGQ